MAKRDLRDAVITIKDGTTPTPLSCTVLIGSGNITWTENTPMEYEPERGNIANGAVRKADEQPVEVSLTCRWVDVTSEGSEPKTPYELMYKLGAAAAAVTIGADTCEPYACKIEILFSPSCSTKDDELVVFSEFRAESVAFDSQAGTMTFSGKSKQVRPTYTRPT